MAQIHPERSFRIRPNPAKRTVVEASPKGPLSADVTDGQLTISLRHLVHVAGTQHLYAVGGGLFLHWLHERP